MVHKEETQTHERILDKSHQLHISNIVKLAIKKGPVVKMFTNLVAQREMCSDEWVTGILTTVGYVFFDHGGIRDFVPTELHVVMQFLPARLTK